MAWTVDNIISTASGLPSDVIAEVRSRVSSSQFKAHGLSKASQQSKFARLVEKNEQPGNRDR